MTFPKRIGTVLLFVALVGAGASTAAASSWTDSFFQQAGRRSPLDSLPPNGLPPTWELVPFGASDPANPSHRSTAVSVDPVRGTVRESYRQGDVEVQEPLVADLEQYGDLMCRRTTERVWLAVSRGNRSMQRSTAARSGGLFRVEVPVTLPKSLRSIVGDGNPNLEVSGSETITLGGTSEWTSRKSDTETKGQSKFPALEMKQELNVNLTGSIGDKIKVDVDQSSNVRTSLDNRVKLRYEGGDDDMVKLVELGNTNLSVAGASFRQDGLFGVKTILKLGTVDLTAIASKQEGKTETARFTPSGEKRRVQIDDLGYIQRRYYIISDHPMDWERGSLVVYKDDQIPSNNTAFVVPGLARVNPEVPFDSLGEKYYRGSFNRLEPGTDYDIITPYLSDVPGTEIPILRFRYALQPQEVIGVAYVEKKKNDAGATYPDSMGSTDLSLVDPVLGKEAGQILLKLIKANPDDIDRDPLTGRYDPTKPLYPVLGLEMRNFYDLQAKNVAIETLSLSVRRRDYGQATDPDNLDGEPLVRMLRLDQRDRYGKETPDGLIDDQFLDADEGILFFPDLHPFDPDTLATASCVPGYSGLLCLDNYGRNRLREQEGPHQANPNVYYVRSPNPQTDSRFYIDAEFRSSQQGFYLGQTDILENSEQVKVDGILLAKGKDYSVDYDTGQITFLRPPGPDQVVTVEYSFAPGVGQVQRTLLGASSSYIPSANFSLTSSLLYESRGASEQNPKLGEEPAVSVVGDLASIATVRPQFMTDLANRIPGVRTNQPSTLNLQGAIALSAPNPNTHGEAYLDDMEGNKEQTIVPLARPAWFWSSIPFDATGSRMSRSPSDHAPIRWYNARGVKEHDLNPDLTNEEGGDNEHQVLEIDLRTPPGVTGYSASTWSGLTQNVSRLGDDYSKMRFLEIWVNDGRQDHTQTRGVLHLDFGEVEEDAFWQPDSPPNNRLDTEDTKNPDTKLDADEDTGLDGLFDVEEPGYDPNTNPDPNGDDYQYSLDRPTDYSHINGTEKSSQGDLNGRPDTEDLNLNGVLDTSNDYFTTSIDLSSATWVATDVAKLYPDVKANNGWRLFRIPILEETFSRQGAPNWDNIKHVRLWLDGLETGATGFNIQIGGIELVGNRWLRQAIPAPLQARNVEFEVGSRNNKDDIGYKPPYTPENAPGGKATQREQSLALVYRSLVPGDSVFAFRTMGDAGALGYTQYRELRYYVHGDSGVQSQNLRLVARFGADTLSYYEYSIPVSSGWKQVTVPMDVLSRVKDDRPDTADVRYAWSDSITGAAEGAVYTVVGNPSFTRVNRITFGLTVHGETTTPGNGEVWVDDLRLAGVRRDKGVAGNMVVQASFADVLALNVGFDSRDAEFFRVGAGGNRGSGFDHKQWNFSSTFNIDRMIPRSGLQLPARFSYQNTVDIPKFKIGSDVVLDPTHADIETSRSNRQSFDMSYQRVGNRRGWTRYSFDALTARALYGRTGSVTPQSTDSSWSFSGGLNYDLPIGGGRGLGITRRFRFKFLPENIRLASTYNSTRNVNYSRDLDNGALTLRRNDFTRTLLLSAGTSWAPINALTLSGSVASDRNMLLRQEGFFGWNRGTQVRYNQRLGASFTPRGILNFTPTLTLDGTYNENGGPDMRMTAADSSYGSSIKNITNGATARLTLALPLGRITSRMGRPTSVHDTTSSWLSAPLRLLRGRVNDIQASFNMDRSTTISRVVGNPGFAFKSGFTQLYDPGLLRLSGSQLANNRRYQGGANTGLKVTPTLSADFRADRSITYSDAAFGSRKTNSVNWPDITVRWLELQRLFGLTGSFTSLALNSHYTSKADESGPTSGRVDRRAENTSWGPLLGWQASLKNGLRVDLTSSYTQFKDVDFAALGSTRVRSTTTHDLRFTKLFPASRGIRFPWSKKPLRLPNDLNLTLTTSLRKNTSETVNAYGFPTTEQDQQILDVQTGTTYNFSQSITGGFTMGYARTQDHKSALTQQRINLAFNAQFRF